MILDDAAQGLRKPSGTAFRNSPATALSPGHKRVGEQPRTGSIGGAGGMSGTATVEGQLREGSGKTSTNDGFGGSVAAEARARGLLVRASAWFVALGPPLVTTHAELAELVGILDAALADIEARVGLAS